MRFWVVLAVAALVCGHASACSCLKPPDPNCDSEYALHVKAGQTTDCKVSDGFAFTVQTKVEIIEALKQPDGSSLKAGDTVTVTSASQSAACGYAMQPGSKHLLYAGAAREGCDKGGKDGLLSVNLCAGNIFNPSDEKIDEYKEECGVKEPPPPTCEEKCEARCNKWCERKCSYFEE